MEHFVPLRAVQERRVVHGDRRNRQLSRVNRPQKILTTLRRRRPPPVIHADRAFGSPTESRRLGPVARRQHRVDGNVQVAFLQLPANDRMVREPDVGMREMDQVDVLDTRRSAGLGAAPASAARRQGDVSRQGKPPSHPEAKPKTKKFDRTRFMAARWTLGRYIAFPLQKALIGISHFDSARIRREQQSSSHSSRAVRHFPAGEPIGRSNGLWRMGVDKMAHTS